MEGVERRLQEHHDKIEVKDSSKARSETAVADTSGIEQSVTPPRALIQVLDSREGAACDQAFSVVWPSGPWKGMPITGYCCEPLCINTGECTGTRFVPHLDQWTSTAPEKRTRRIPDPPEIVAAARAMAKRASKQTGRDEDRTDAEILELTQRVWRKTIEQIRGKGEWRR